MKVKTDVKAGGFFDRVRKGLKKGLNVALSKGKKKKPGKQASQMGAELSPDSPAVFE
jgi:hypothetical protein